MPNRALSLVFIKLAVIAVIGGVAVYVLNDNRGQSVVEVRGVPIVVPVVLVILWVGTFVLTARGSAGTCTRWAAIPRPRVAPE